MTPGTKVAHEKTFPAAMVDQRTYWIDPKGIQRLIVNMDDAEVKQGINFLFGNAAQVRRHYAVEKAETFDTLVRPRVWILDRVVTRGLMARLLAIEVETQTREREEEEARIVKRNAFQLRPAKPSVGFFDRFFAGWVS